MARSALPSVDAGSCGAAACLLESGDIARGEPAPRIAGLENVPEHAVGAELLVAIYAHLDMAVAFVDMPAKRSQLSRARADSTVTCV